MSVTEIRETSARSTSRTWTATQPDVTAAPRVENRVDTAEQAEGVGFTAEASELSATQGVRSVLLDMLGENESPKPVDAASAYRTNETVPLEGYNYDKLNDPNHNTPKYIFGRVAQHYKLDSVQGDKKNAESLLNAMVPELKAAGLDIVAVKGDRIQVKTEVGYEWVDVVRGAGGDNPGWWWGSEGKGTPNPTATPQEWAAATGVGQDGSAGTAGGGAVSGMGGGAAAQGGILGAQIDRARVMAILEKYPPTNEGIRQAMPELQKAFPGVQLLEHPKRLDKLQFPNGAVIDVIVGAGGNEPKWGWGPEN